MRKIKSIKRSLRIVFLIIVLLFICFFGCKREEQKPLIEDYQYRFGYSLDGIRTEILEYDHEKSFRDPWSAYVVRLAGTIDGSDFDPETMAKGVMPIISDALKVINNDRKVRGLEPLLQIGEPKQYRSKIWIQKDKIAGSSYFLVIYDMNSGLYYCMIESFS